MKLLKYLALELKTEKDGPLYAIRNKSKAQDLVLLLNYLFFEYTRNDLALIVKNLAVIDEEMDDEIVVHGNSRCVAIDLAQPANLYIALLQDYFKFEDSPSGNAIDITFVDELKKKKFESVTINRNCFLKLLRDWHTIIEKKPIRIALYQDLNKKIGFQSFATAQAADVYEKQYCPR
jgi:hypothetical protein